MPTSSKKAYWKLVQLTGGAPQTEDEVISLLPVSIRDDVRITVSDELVVSLDVPETESIACWYAPHG